jgi:hypothetical protein
MTTEVETSHVNLSKGTTTDSHTTAAEPRRRSPRRNQLAVDWVAGHGAVSAPIAMATTAAGVATMGAWTGMPGAWPLAVGVVGAAAHGLGHGMRRRLSRPTLMVRATGWLLASGWSSAVIAAQPHTWGPTGWWSAAGSLTAIAVGVGSGLAKADVHEEAAEELRLAARKAMADSEIDRADWELVDQWLALIKAVATVDVHPIGIERRRDNSGFGLEVELPVGFPADRLFAHATALAEAARLPAGCLVRISGATRQGRVILDVDTVDTAGTVTEYPEFTPLSILTGIPWGLSRVGEEVYVYMREACALLLGPPGSGKTTLLDGILAGFARCNDVITWGIDLGKQGDAFVPWVVPWLEGQGFEVVPEGKERAPKTTVPTVDWIGSNYDEAEAILDAALAVGAQRLTAYRGLMRRENTKLLPVSAAVPMILVVIDEGVEMLSYTGPDKQRKRLKEKMLEIMRTLRAMAIRLVLTATDGNVSSIGDSTVRKYSPVRVALTCTDSEGAGVSKLFGRVKGLDARQLTAKGSGVIGAATDPGFSPMPMRTWVTHPSLAREATLATNKWRAKLDGPSARVLGKEYQGRWSRGRLAWLLDDLDAKLNARSTEGESADLGLRRRPETTPTTTEPEQSVYVNDDQDATVAAFLAELSKLPETTDPQETPADPPADPAPEDDRPTNLPPGLTLRTRSPREPSPSGSGPSWKQAAIAVLKMAGPGQWLSTGLIKERLEETGIEIGRSALSTALAEMSRKGEIQKRGNGPQTEYAARA